MIPSNALAYALVAALLASLTKGRRRRNGGRMLKAAALGAGVAIVAPRLGVRVPVLAAGTVRA